MLHEPASALNNLADALRSLKPMVPDHIDHALSFDAASLIMAAAALAVLLALFGSRK